MKFIGEPNLVVRFNPPIGLLKYVKFDENGEFSTDNERVIHRLMSRFDHVESSKKEEISKEKESPKPKKPKKSNKPKTEKKSKAKRGGK